jgi:hypothetical protein
MENPTSKKWYNYFLSVDQPGESRGEQETPAEGEPASGAPRSAARTVADIASGVTSEPKFTGPVGAAMSFEEIYGAAEINVPQHGYTILKIIELLHSEHIRNLSRDVKRSSLLLALEAAGVKAEEIVQDAVRRDKALDTYEHVQQKALQDLEAGKTKESQELQAEIEKRINELQTRVQANNDEVTKAKEQFYGWQLKKQQEEQKIADAVSYFTSEKPSTAGGEAGASPAPGGKKP